MDRKISRKEAIDGFKEYTENCIRRIFHTRALLLAAERTNKDKLKTELDEFITTIGKRYMERYDKMDETALHIEALAEMSRLIGGEEAINEMFKENNNE